MNIKEFTRLRTYVWHVWYSDRFWEFPNTYQRGLTFPRFRRIWVIYNFAWNSKKFLQVSEEPLDFRFIDFYRAQYSGRGLLSLENFGKKSLETLEMMLRQDRLPELRDAATVVRKYQEFAVLNPTEARYRFSEFPRHAWRE